MKDTIYKKKRWYTGLPWKDKESLELWGKHPYIKQKRKLYIESFRHIINHQIIQIACLIWYLFDWSWICLIGLSVFTFVQLFYAFRMRKIYKGYYRSKRFLARMRKEEPHLYYLHYAIEEIV
jgi:hypothetical protein